MTASTQADVTPLKLMVQGIVSFVHSDERVWLGVSTVLYPAFIFHPLPGLHPWTFDGHCPLFPGHLDFLDFIRPSDFLII